MITLSQKIRKLAEEIPEEDQSYFAGTVYNAYLKEAFDPNTKLYPKELKIQKKEGAFWNKCLSHVL